MEAAQQAQAAMLFERGESDERIAALLGVPQDDIEEFLNGITMEAFAELDGRQSV